MTFSIAARCSRSGMFGIAVSSSSICVASRCGVWARAGAGVVATQNVTDPRLGAIGLDLLAGGHSAASAIAQMAASNAHPEYRQIAVVDQDGGTGYYSGAKTLGLNRVVGGCGCVAAGNILSAEEVPAKMVAAFEASSDHHLAECLWRGLEAGLEAGGLGFSTSRSFTHTDGDGAPIPSRVATDDEVVALSSVVADHPGTA